MRWGREKGRGKEEGENCITGLKLIVESFMMQKTEKHEITLSH